MNRTRADRPRSWIVRPRSRKEAVVQQPGQVERPAAVARHVGVAEHEIHVVDRVQPAEEAAEEGSHCGGVEGRRWLGPRDQQHDLLGIEGLAVGQPAVGIASDAADGGGEVPADDLAAEDFVVQPVIGQVMGVEKVTERPVAHVVQQAGQPHERFDVAAAGHIRADFAEAVVERRHGAAGQVHRAEDVLEPRMLGRGKDPPGGLQLVDLPQALQPRIVEYFLLAGFAFRQSRGRSERDIAVDRIVAEPLALKVFHASMLPPERVRFQGLRGRGGNAYRPGLGNYAKVMLQHNTFGGGGRLARAVTLKHNLRSARQGPFPHPTRFRD